MNTTTKQNAAIIRDLNRRLVGLRAEMADTKAHYEGRAGYALMMRTLEEDEYRIELRLKRYAA